MPQLDVSFMLSDPMLMSSFDVERRTETIGGNGRASLTALALPGQHGVVTPVDPDKLERGADGQHQTKAISVRTRFVLRDAGPLNAAPDIVIYAGDRYEVKFVKPWRFGQGWYTAHCETTVVQDPPDLS